MSYDFAAIVPELVNSIEDAQRLHIAMCDDVQQPAPPAVVAFIAELDSRHGVHRDDDSRLLTCDCGADARGTVVATSSDRIAQSTTALLTLTRDFGFVLFDPQRTRLYDPRGHVDIWVTLNDGTDVPYLSERLIAELFAHPDARYGPWFVIKRDDQHFVQALFHPDQPVVVEHRAGGPDQHFQALIDDRRHAQAALWSWTVGTDVWHSLPWQRIEL